MSGKKERSKVFSVFSLNGKRLGGAFYWGWVFDEREKRETSDQRD